jgi:hypothetical protein
MNSKTAAASELLSFGVGLSVALGVAIWLDATEPLTLIASAAKPTARISLESTD